MSTMEQCIICRQYYTKETKKYKLSFDTPAINKVCDDCFEAIMRWILLGDEDYCIHQKLEIEHENLINEQKKLLIEEQNLRILQQGKIKMRKLYD